jgi:hypothetical protein
MIKPFSTTTDERPALIRQVRDAARSRYARWDDRLFDALLEARLDHIWRALKTRPPEHRLASARTYVDLVVAGIGEGVLHGAHGEPSSLLEAFIRDKIPYWFGESNPDRHGKIASLAWNIADGARAQAAWIDQYLLANLHEFENPMCLKEKAAELLRPVLEETPAARWSGPATVTVIALNNTVADFLPGKLTVVTPRLVSIADRRRDVRLGVLLMPDGDSRCLGLMRSEGAGMTDDASLPPIRWTAADVSIGDLRVALPLTGSLPLETLALPSGYLLASLPNSQRLWVIDSP